MPQTQLPRISELVSEPVNSEQLATVLQTLFEPYPRLNELLVTQLTSEPATLSSLKSYDEFIDATVALMLKWTPDDKAFFVHYHPVDPFIQVTPEDAKADAVTARLAHLNQLYLCLYPAMHFITFVNGRSREEIVRELEDTLGVEHSLEPNLPSTEEFKRVSCANYSKELSRGIAAVGEAAKAKARASSQE